MATKRFLRTSIDWAAFAERIPPHEKANFLKFKTRVDGYMKNLMKYPEKPPAINWSMYKSRLPPQLVSDFEKQYNSMKIPYPPDKLSSLIDQQEKEVAKYVEEYIELSNLRCQCHEKQLQWHKDMMPFEQMTFDDTYDYYKDSIIADHLTKPNFYPYDEPPEPVFPYRKKKSLE